MKVILFITTIFCMSFTDLSETKLQGTSNSFNPSTSWQIFGEYNGVKVEYKEERITFSGRYTMVVFFKFTNSTNVQKSISFDRLYYMNDECWNCNKLGGGEHSFTIELDANSSIEGSAGNLDHKYYIFKKWMKLVPGMTDHELTNVEFTNVTVQ